MISAPSRESLIQRTRALDRVLLWGHYVIPQLMAPFDRFLYWDKFGRPDRVPLQGPSVLRWWIDPQKARTLDQRSRAVGDDEESCDEFACDVAEAREALAVHGLIHCPQPAAAHPDVVRHKARTEASRLGTKVVSTYRY